MKKKLCSLLMVFSILFCSVNASAQTLSTDDVLRSKGVPNEVIKNNVYFFERAYR